MKFPAAVAWVVADKYTNEAHTITDNLIEADEICSNENEKTGYERFWIRSFNAWQDDIEYEARREGETGVGWL